MSSDRRDEKKRKRSPSPERHSRNEEREAKRTKRDEDDRRDKKDKDRHRSHDKEKSKDREKERDRERDREKEKDTKHHQNHHNEKREEEKPKEEDLKAIELKKRRERLMQWKASNEQQLKSLLEAFGSEEEPKKRELVKIEPSGPLRPEESTPLPVTDTDEKLLDDEDEDEDDKKTHHENSTEEQTDEKILAAKRNAAAERAAAADKFAMATAATSVTETLSNMATATSNSTTDEIDPLDAYMSNISKEFQHLTEVSLKKEKKDIVRGENITVDEEDPIEAVSSDEPEDLLKKMKKRVLEQVDHSKINYPPFRKDFYIEVPEIAKMTDEEVAEYRKSLEGIRIRGKNCPKPIKTFAQCGLSAKILAIMKKYGYEKPTPIQAQALPAIMSGRDVIGIAKTGSGKTLAYLLPLFRHVMDQPPLKPGDGPIALIMAPTRELVCQIHAECKKFKPATELRSIAVYGGAGVASQIGDLKRGGEIVVCTPGRMIDILSSNKGRITNLLRVTYLVLDEADRMFDMGFEPQIMRIINNIRPDRQTVMFSATFPRPVENAARKILKNPIEITIRGRAVVADTIEQIIEVVHDGDKFRRVMALIPEWYEKGSILIFVDTQEAVDALFHDILKSGFNCRALHGGMDQIDRDSTIDDFKSGRVKILVATSVAARGLDVPQIRLVVNYDVPNHLEDYVHRVGRTGRAGREGTAITYITPDEDQYAPDLVKALTQAGKPVPEELKKLADGFEEKVKAGKAKKHISGFVKNTGYQFTEEEEERRRKEKKLQRLMLGVEEDISDEDIEPKKDEEKDELLEQIKENQAEKEKEIGIEKEAEVIATSSPPPPTIGVPTEEKVTASTAASVSPLGVPAAVPPIVPLPFGIVPPSPLIAMVGMVDPAKTESVIDEALKQVQKQPSSASLSPEEAMKKAQKFAEELNLKATLAKAALSSVIGTRRHEAEFEINDFPQQARWKVTNKEALAAVTEFTGCAITVKGVYCPPGKNPPPGERRLYLLIEGPSDEAVANAKTELKKLLEAVMLTIKPERRQPGKYSV